MSENLNTRVCFSAATNVSNSTIFTLADIAQGKTMKTIDEEQFDILLPAFIFIIMLVVLGFPGNIISILVYKFQLKSTTGRDAIITLAICDVINCVLSIPIELFIMTQYYTFENAALCKMSRFVTYSMNNCSGLILMAIALERYRTICTPHKPKLQKTQMRAVICVMVVLGPLLALPSLWIYGIQTDFMYKDGSFVTPHVVTTMASRFESLIGEPNINVTFNGSDVTSYTWNNSKDTVIQISRTKRCLIDDSVRDTWFTYSFFGFLTIASTSVMFILVLIYSQIAMKIRGLKNLASTPSEMSRDRTSAKKKHATFVLFLITVAFQFSFLPFLIITNLRFFTAAGWYNCQSRAGKMSYQFFLRSYFFNSAINPFIYCVSSPHFRSAMCKLNIRLKGQKNKACCNS